MYFHEVPRIPHNRFKNGYWGSRRCHIGNDLNNLLVIFSHFTHFKMVIAGPILKWFPAENKFNHFSHFNHHLVNFSHFSHF